MIKVKPLVWSETKPLKLSSNQHDCCCKAHTPFGSILITWKEEEADQSAKVFLLFDRYGFHDFPREHDGVEKAKEACELEYRRRILSALIEEEPQFTKEEVEMHSAPWSYLNPPSDDELPADGDLLSLKDLRDAWNAGADRFNSWDELGLDEIIAFAQREAVNKWRKMNKSKAD